MTGEDSFAKALRQLWWLLVVCLLAGVVMPCPLRAQQRVWTNADLDRPPTITPTLPEAELTWLKYNQFRLPRRHGGPHVFIARYAPPIITFVPARRLDGSLLSDPIRVYGVTRGFWPPRPSSSPTAAPRPPRPSGSRTPRPDPR